MLAVTTARMPAAQTSATALSERFVL